METNFINYIFTKSLNNINLQNKPYFSQHNTFPNLAPLKKDTVSFKGADKKGKNTQKIKKSDFKGIDLSIIEKFRIDISRYTTIDDLQKWAETELQKIYMQKEYPSRQEETDQHRKILLQEWFDYLQTGNDAYTPVMKLLITISITKDLKQNNDMLPPVLNKGVLADTMTEIVEQANINSKYDVNFCKIYNKKLQALYLEDETGKENEDITKWVIIPSKKHSHKNFTSNVNKLKALSHPNWCTKSFNAKPYLSDGDFHIYIENGEPKLGVRFVNNQIEEIQGELNNTRIPQKYFETLKKHIEENNYKLAPKATKEIEEAEKTKVNLENIKKEIGEEAIKNNDPEKILTYYGMKVQKDSDGLYIIDKYYAPSQYDETYQNLGIDENLMMSKIKEIKGNADFRRSHINTFKNLKTVGGNVILARTPIRSLGSLENVEGSLELEYSKIQDLGNLVSVGNHLNIHSTKHLKNLGKLEYIGGSLKLKDSNITSLDNLQEIGADVTFRDSAITDLGNLQRIGHMANFQDSSIKSLANLEYIGGTADFSYSSVKDLGKLTFIGGDAIFSHSPIKNLKNLKYIKGKAIFTCSSVKKTGKLAYNNIGMGAELEGSKLEIKDFRKSHDDDNNGNTDDYYDEFNSSYLNSMDDFDEYMYRLES